MRKKNQEQKPVKVVRIELETEDGSKHALWFTPREIYLIIGAMAVLNDIGASEGVGLAANEHTIMCFTEHMNMIESLAEPEQIHQLFHRIRDFFKDRNLV